MVKWSLEISDKSTLIAAVRSSTRTRCVHCCCSWAAGLWCCRKLEVSTLCSLLLLLSGRWPVLRAPTKENLLSVELGRGENRPHSAIRTYRIRPLGLKPGKSSYPPSPKKEIERPSRAETWANVSGRAACVRVLTVLTKGARTKRKVGKTVRKFGKHTHTFFENSLPPP